MTSYADALTIFYTAYGTRDGLAELRTLLTGAFRDVCGCGLTDDLGNGQGAGLRVVIEDTSPQPAAASLQQTIRDHLAPILPGMPVLVQRKADTPVYIVATPFLAV